MLETTFVFIYVSESLLASPGPERKPVDAHALLFNARHSTDTRKADFTLLKLPCDCCALVPHRSDLCIHLYSRFDFYLDSVARNAALHYSSASYSASRWLDSRLILLPLNIYARVSPYLVMLHLQMNRTSQKMIAIAYWSYILQMSSLPLLQKIISRTNEDFWMI